MLKVDPWGVSGLGVWDPGCKRGSGFPVAEKTYLFRVPAYGVDSKFKKKNRTVP